MRFGNAPQLPKVGTLQMTFSFVCMHDGVSTVDHKYGSFCVDPRVALIGEEGARPRKEDLLRSEIHSCSWYVCMYIFANIANIA